MVPEILVAINGMIRKLGDRDQMCDRVDQLPWDFHIIGDGKLNPIVGIYIPIIRIPVIKGWMSLSPIQGVDRPWLKCFY